MSELATQCIDRQIAALSRLHGVIHKPEYQKILQIITDTAKRDFRARVMIAGVGKNANIASKISETMASLGIPSFYLNVSHCGHGDFGFIGHEDVIIHISRSGTTREMMVAMEHIKLIRPNVKQILIHCKQLKPVNPFVDVELFIGAVAEGDEFGLAPTTSTTALLCTLDCLSVEASNAIGFKRLDFLKYHPDGALGDLLKAEQARLEAFDQMQKQVTITTTAKPGDPPMMISPHKWDNEGNTQIYANVNMTRTSTGELPTPRQDRIVSSDDRWDERGDALASMGFN